MNIGGAPLVLRRFQIDETGTSGANVWIEARQPGLVSFLLTIVGLDPNSSLRVTRGSISFQNSSVFGMNQVSTPLANIGAFVGGYKKPFWALVFSGLMLFAGLSFAFTEDGGALFGIFAFLALVGLLYYYLQKTMFMGFETSGGGTYGFAFKASVLEGVGVDIKRVESTIAYVNSLISSASLGEAFVEQPNPSLGRPTSHHARLGHRPCRTTYARTDGGRCPRTGRSAGGGPTGRTCARGGTARRTGRPADTATRFSAGACTRTTDHATPRTSDQPADDRHAVPLATRLIGSQPLPKGRVDVGQWGQ